MVLDSSALAKMYFKVLDILAHCLGMFPYKDLIPILFDSLLKR
jgi:hypothetical protein